MALHDWTYWREPGKENPLAGIGFGLPPAGRAVKYLLIANVAVYVLQLFFDGANYRSGSVGQISRWLGVTADAWWQVYRYITFQFLHDPDNYWHILLNMLGLYIIGSPLEQLWGTRRFTIFYLACGAVAGVAYAAVMAIFHLPGWIPIIGASGGVYAVILAGAVFLPHIRIIFLFFPVPIRLAALIIFGGMIIMVSRAMLLAVNGTPLLMTFAMSDVAHLGGAGAAAVSIWLVPRLRLYRVRRAITHGRIGRGIWKRRLAKEAKAQAEIDRILQKIHEHGLQSLTHGEKRQLKHATERQRAEEEDVYRR